MTSRCETAGGSRRPWPGSGNRGIALVAALVVMALVSAIGLGLVITTNLEPLAAANYESSWAAFFAAESGIALAAHELAVADWNLVLAGQLGSSLLDPSGGLLDLPDGSRSSVVELTNLATCGHAGPCAEAEAAAFTLERPWGPNNPRWRVFGHGRIDRLIPTSAGVPAIEVVVWVGDDPADSDEDPLRDSGVGPWGDRRPGGCVVALRAEAFGSRSAHRTIVATVARPDPGCGPGIRLVSWRELN